MVMKEQKKRFIYIDLLRGLAVLVMVEVHVFNTFLIPELREADWFKVLNFMNGIVAPSFLFISGYAFVLVAQRKWNEYLSFSPIFWKQVGRVLQVWIVGYALHLPFFSFRRLLLIESSEWGVFWKVDVLHCIAFSLTLLLLCVLLFREQKKFFAATTVVCLFAVFISPFIYDVNFDGKIIEPFANYLSAAHRSQFPLFPWMAFVLSGGIISQLVVWWKEHEDEKKTFLRLLMIGMLLIVVSIITKYFGMEIFPPHDYWRSSPGFFFMRLGIVIVLLSGLWFWEQKYHSQKSLVSIVGSESLVAYAGHLLVIYGMFFNDHSLSFLIGKTRTVAEVSGMTIILVAATITASYIWNRIKGWSMTYARFLQYSLLLIVVYIFFTKPY